MNQLRLAPRPAPQSASDDACLDAFQQQLNYVHRSFRRLGALSFDVEDLTQDLFLAFRRSWSEYDPNRPLRPYLFGFAFRIAAAHKRKRRREVAYGIVTVDDPGPGPGKFPAVEASARPASRCARPDSPSATGRLSHARARRHPVGRGRVGAFHSPSRPTRGCARRAGSLPKRDFDAYGRRRTADDLVKYKAIA